MCVRARASLGKTRYYRKRKQLAERTRNAYCALERRDARIAPASVNNVIADERVNSRTEPVNGNVNGNGAAAVRDRYGK